MKLLVDQNLSFKLIPALSEAFPDSKHLKDFNLTREQDEEMDTPQTRRATYSKLRCRSRTFTTTWKD